MKIDRRRFLAGTAGVGLAAAVPRLSAADGLALLRAGGVVLALRHARAPGTFDPPGFRLGDCSTQRNLDEQGREQARRIGGWFKAQGLTPAAVRSSPWCRCLDTAQLAFGQAEAWPALGSPREGDARSNAEALAQLHQALVAATGRPGRFEVWVTHMFVLADLVGGDASAGEGLVLGAQANGKPRLLARIDPAPR